ncbi:TetR/AcrR family transcriptional regulator [Nocardia sp. 004]|uniref:TetR/AcrR family transcriptional regulator n=1 Tax=Nocardia sp. 004 TaxID=3385978 RepID=UPI00399F599F
MATSTGKSLRADAARNRAAVVAAARAAFSGKGVEAPLDDIARAAGVSPGTLYRHFPTRSDLVAATVADHVAELRADADRLDEADDPVDALVQWIRLLSDYAGVYAGLPDTVLAAGPDSEGPLSHICRSLEALTDGLVARARGRVRAEVDGADVFVLANALAWADGHDPERDRSEARLAVLIRGIID